MFSFLISIAIVLFDSFWLGGSKLGNEPFFYWMGVNKPMNVYTDWKTDPNKSGYSKGCILMVKENEKQYWGDSDCYGLNYFVCEKI